MRYEVLDGDAVANVILAEPEFMSSNFPDGNYREIEEGSATTVPELVVVSLSCDPDPLEIDQDSRVVTCSEGSKVTANCELRVGGTVIPITDTFRMPIRSSDGREEFILAKMKEGIVSAVFSARDSGLWTVTEDGINERMAEGSKMTFLGVTVFVVQS